jgi:hypothetical protein
MHQLLDRTVITNYFQLSLIISYLNIYTPVYLIKNHSILQSMSYPLDLSYGYSSSDDSFSYISDPWYCPVHNPVPPSGLSTLPQPYPYYYQVPIIQPQVSSPRYLPSSSVFQVSQKKTRRFTSEQIQILEDHFDKINKYVDKTTIDDLSTRTQLTPAQIRVWFNNKRTRARENT